MKTRMVIAVLAALLMSAAHAQAIPSLQLDIANGTYSSSGPLHSPETVVGPATAAGQPVTLYAYLLPDGDKNTANSTTPLNDFYYLSLAVYPQVAQATPPPDLGRISVNGVDISVTSQMRYGTPPYETFMSQQFEAQDLAKHSIYDTYFLQLQFSFDPTQFAQAYNTQDDAGAGPSPYASGSPMYYEAFSIDTTGLAEGYFIHFDLYNSYSVPVTERQRVQVGTRPNGNAIYETIEVVVGGDMQINSFAPFSHDAETDGHKVPEAGTILLLGSGLFGLGLMRRRRDS